MELCKDCGKAIGFFTTSNVVEGNLICGECDDKRRSKEKKDKLVFKTKLFPLFFLELFALSIGVLIYILPSQQHELEERIQAAVICFIVVLIGLLAVTSVMIEYLSLEIFESERYIEGVAGAYRIKIPFDKIDWNLTLKRTTLQRWGGSSSIWSKDGECIRIDGFFLGQTQVDLIHSKLERIKKEYSTPKTI